MSFLSQDGMILAATLRGMAGLGLDGAGGLLSTRIASLQASLPSRGFAHLQIGLRSLAQAGWVVEPPATNALGCEWTAEGTAARAHFEDYVQVGDLLSGFGDSAPDVWQRPWTDETSTRFGALARRAAEGWGLDRLDRLARERSEAHLTGALLASLLLSLRARDRLRDAGPTVDAGALGESQYCLLEAAGWIDRDRAWTSAGRGGIAFIPHLGLTASYLPLLACLPHLYRGEDPAPPGAHDDTREWHVQRELNIEASTFAHHRYFADADAIIAAIFDREPLSTQPRFVMDVGCGDGSWLCHVDRLVREHTLRGRNLAAYPLTIVGVDHAPAAIDQARANLAASGTSAVIVRGDISAPDQLRDTLAAHGLAIEDGLHLRAFVDHDRLYHGTPAVPGCCPSLRQGLYLDARGHGLSPAQVEEDLARHLSAWAPHARHHGLILLEAHRVAPSVSARQQGFLHSIAFDAYHGYSAQYPLDRAAFLAAVRTAGLRTAASEGRAYPASRPAVAVSLNRLLVGRSDESPPGGVAASAAIGPLDPEGDGLALHRLLYENGDVRHPRGWCAAPTRQLIAEAMAFLEMRLETTRGDRLRVCDYGTGTGLAAIELLKACGERGFFDRLALRGMTLELHLADLPSAWFAQGQALLGQYPNVRFHSLLDGEGRFRTLAEPLGRGTFDLVLASMVFHLIPPPALSRVAADLADLLGAGGALLWNAPDLSPAAPGTILFHDPNRLLRQRWKALLGSGTGASPAQNEAIAQAARGPDGSITFDDLRAGRRVLAIANSADLIAAALSPCFSGMLTSAPHDMLAREALDAIIVPSNHRELLPEIGDDGLRRTLVAEMMRDAVLPEVCAGPAGNGAGFAVHWTGGAFRRRDQLPMTKLRG